MGDSNEMKKLSYGIFWVITDSREIDNYTLVMFAIPCDAYGNITDEPEFQLNAKSGLTYNHEKLWREVVQKRPEYRPYNRKEYNYYPRGRVVIGNKRATIYVNPHINIPAIVDEITSKFGLISDNIRSVKVANDGSVHYRCWVDWETE